jgi:hypothetical protein
MPNISAETARKTAHRAPYSTPTVEVVLSHSETRTNPGPGGDGKIAAPQSSS